MKRLGFTLAASVAFLTTPALAAQTSGPNAEVLAPIDAMLKASMSGDIPTLVAQYAPGCVFADEFAPFYWSGPDAMRDYFTAGGRMYQETRHRDDKPVFGPAPFVYVSGDRAFVIEKVSGAANVRGKPYASAGEFAFALVKIDGRWKIISQTWTKTRESFDPYKD
jgi:ketosteroid isomerase-like protein